MKKFVKILCCVLSLSLSLLTFSCSNESPDDTPTTPPSADVGSSSGTTGETEDNPETPENETNPTPENPETPSVEIDFSDKTYLTYGDSITYGLVLTPTGYIQAEKPYPTLAAETLGMKACVNKGVCSATTKDVCGYIDSTTESADIISVMSGVCDRAGSRPLGTISDNTTSTIYGCYNLIAQKLKAKYPNAFIFFMTPFKCRGWENPYAGYTLEDVATAMKRVAFEHNIPVLDTFNYGQYELEMYNEDSDGLHPSQEFFENYTAPQIAQFIRENYGK